MKITVTSTVLHNRTHLLPGTVADVDDDTAANWIERGIAEAHEPTPEPERVHRIVQTDVPDIEMTATIETTPLPAGRAQDFPLTPSRRGRRPKAKDE